MSSIWKTAAVLPPRPRLEGGCKTEAAVVGGGLAGVLIARALEEAGVQTVLLEAETLGSGQTGNTTAKITSQHGLRYARLLEQLGEEKAGQYARANQRAVEEYRRIILAGNIPCDFEGKPAYLYSTLEAEPLEKEVRAARRLGLDAEFTADTALPFPVKGAVRFGDQAQFHPLKFLAAMAEGLSAYEHTPVVEVEDNTLYTPEGRVEAGHVVFAAHYPFVNAPGYYFLRQHQERSYVLALEGAGTLDGMYLGVDPDGLSFRNYGPYLLLGGGGHRTGENSSGGRYERLRQAAQRLWPGCREAARWSAQDCMPLDGVPYIGRFSASTPNWYVATGFQKWGMTSSMVAARIISGLITGREDPDGEVFSPQRFHLPASAKNLLEDGRQAVKGLTKGFLVPAGAQVEALPRGHGGVVEAGGEKVGVYKDENGEIFTVSIRCPHLGCQLEWNPDEKSWDCPCHGSRFDFRGSLIDNPAQEDLVRPEAHEKGSSR